VNTSAGILNKAMKKTVLFLLLSFMLIESRAQTICDSTYTICDSLSIDTVFIAHSNNFDQLIFQVDDNYHFLYAPNFVICPDSDSVQFVDDVMDFTGIFGPSLVGLQYTFENFNFPNGFQISGTIVLDNSNIGNNNCQFPFSITVNALGLNDPPTENSFVLFPVPANDHLTVKAKNENDKILHVQLFDLAGIQQKISFTDNTIDVSEISPGLYTVHLELRNGSRIREKIIIE